MILLGMSLIGSSLVALASNPSEMPTLPRQSAIRPAAQTPAGNQAHQSHGPDSGTQIDMCKCPGFGWWCPTCCTHHSDPTCPNNH